MATYALPPLLQLDEGALAALLQAVLPVEGGAATASNEQVLGEWWWFSDCKRVARKYVLYPGRNRIGCFCAWFLQSLIGVISYDRHWGRGGKLVIMGG